MRIEVLGRAPLAGGKAFGAAGAFERITGRLHYAMDPAHHANAPIADVRLAPRGAVLASLAGVLGAGGGGAGGGGTASRGARVSRF